jgi:hypothetical protein
MLISAPAGSVNHVGVYGNTAGGPVYLAAAGTDANIPIYLSAKGTSAVNIGNTGGASTVQVIGNASTANTFQIFGAAAGTAPGISAVGTDANVSLNLTSKGTGTVQANSVPVVTTTGPQTVTNKTISGASNTITNLPASATPNASRLVATTANVAGVNHWAKLMSFDTTGAFTAATLNLKVCVFGQAASAEVNLHVGATIQSAVSPTISVLSATGNPAYIRPDNFKVIRSAIGTPVELWMKAPSLNVSFFVYEMAGSYTASKVTYHQNATWQADEPVGSEYNVVSAATPLFMNNPVGVRVAVPASATAAGASGQWAADNSWIYVCIASGNWRRAALSTW